MYVYAWLELGDSLLNICYSPVGIALDAAVPYPDLLFELSITWVESNTLLPEPSVTADAEELLPCQRVIVYGMMACLALNYRCGTTCGWSDYPFAHCRVVFLDETSCPIPARNLSTVSGSLPRPFVYEHRCLIPARNVAL